MNTRPSSRFSLAIFAMITLVFSMLSTSCGDDDSQPSTSDGDKPLPDIGIGNACSCEELQSGGCSVLGVPLPSPAEDKGKIVGCDAVDATGIVGAKSVCLRTISSDYAAIAPTVYAPDGYCTLSAVKADMENDTFKQLVEYGDADAFTKCPKGSALISSTFDYKIAGQDAKITNKTCVKLCRTDADCNVDGEMTCLERQNVKFCYHEKNLEISEKFTIEAF